MDFYLPVVGRDCYLEQSRIFVWLDSLPISLVGWLVDWLAFWMRLRLELAEFLVLVKSAEYFRPTQEIWCPSSGAN